MRTITLIFISILVFSSCKRQSGDSSIESEPQSRIDWDYADSIKNSIQQAEIPGDTFYLQNLEPEYNTSQIQNAVDKVHNMGGGTVIITKGEYLCTPIILKSKINLHLEEGAIIKFIPNPEYYPMAYTWFNGIPCMNYAPMIYAMNETDIKISGKGTFDGQGYDSVWTNMKYGEKADWDLLKRLEKENTKPQNRKFGKGHSIRPELSAFVQCSRITISGVSFINSPYWTIHPIMCNNITIKNSSINSQGYNQIGIALESSEKVLIDSLKIKSVGEGIKILSGRVNIKNNNAAKNIIIQNSTFENIAYSAVIISSKIIAGAQNIFMSGLKINNTKSAISIYGERLGYLRDVYVKNIVAKNITGSFLFGRILRSKNSTPTISNIYLDNIQAEDCSRSFFIQGHSQNPFRNITISNSDFSTINGSFVKYAETFDFVNVKENNKMYNGSYTIGQLNIPKISLENNYEEILDSDDIQFDKLPEDVKNTLALKYPQTPITDIDRMTTSSNVIYEIKLNLNNEFSNELTLLIQLDGKIIRTKTECIFDEIPEPVKTTLKAYLGTPPSPLILSDIRKISYQDLVYYEIKGEYAGKLYAFSITENGEKIEEKQLTITTYFSHKLTEFN